MLIFLVCNIIFVCSLEQDIAIFTEQQYKVSKASNWIY